MVALVFTTLIAFVSFLSSLYGSGTVYLWLVNASSLAGFIAWWGISYSHHRFRKAYVAQGRDLKDLKFRALWYPFGPIFALIICSIVIAGQNVGAFMSPKGIDWMNVLVSYVGLPLFILFYLGYKYIKKTKTVPLTECDFSTDVVTK